MCGWAAVCSRRIYHLRWKATGSGLESLSASGNASFYQSRRLPQTQAHHWSRREPDVVTKRRQCADATLSSPASDGGKTEERESSSLWFFSRIAHYVNQKGEALGPHEWWLCAGALNELHHWLLKMCFKGTVKESPNHFYLCWSEPESFFFLHCQVMPNEIRKIWVKESSVMLIYQFDFTHWTTVLKVVDSISTGYLKVYLYLRRNKYKLEWPSEESSSRPILVRPLYEDSLKRYSLMYDLWPWGSKRFSPSWYAWLPILVKWCKISTNKTDRN